MKNQRQLEELAAFVVREAGRLGATGCDVTISAYDSVNLTVRNGEVEQHEDVRGGRGLSFRAFVRSNSASTNTSDFRRRSLTQLVRATIALARASEPDEYAGLPEHQHLARSVPDLSLFDPKVAVLDQESKLKLALSCERAALSGDKSIKHSNGVSFRDRSAVHVYANSHGFLGSFPYTTFSLSASVVADDGSGKQSGNWWSQARKFNCLESPEAIGAMAATRALRMLGARRVKSQSAPVVFDPQMSARLLSQFASAAQGASIYRRSSFLVDKLGEMVAAPELQIIDDPLIPGAMGSQPFDDEGLASVRRPIVCDGRLESYFLDSYAARKLAMEPTSGGASNLFIRAGSTPPDEIIASVKSGLYLTGLAGQGFNAVTGSYSFGATGIWIEDGRLAFPVQGITIASSLPEMLLSIEAIGNDLEFRTGVSAPTLKIARMTIAGE